jgi:hypothetical protein
MGSDEHIRLILFVLGMVDGDNQWTRTAKALMVYGDRLAQRYRLTVSGPDILHTVLVNVLEGLTPLPLGIDNPSYAFVWLETRVKTEADRLRRQKEHSARVRTGNGTGPQQELQSMNEIEDTESLTPEMFAQFEILLEQFERHIDAADERHLKTVENKEHSRNDRPLRRLYELVMHFGDRQRLAVEMKMTPVELTALIRRFKKLAAQFFRAHGVSMQSDSLYPRIASSDPAARCGKVPKVVVPFRSKPGD